jgi:hypothetical protein
MLQAAIRRRSGQPGARPGEGRGAVRGALAIGAVAASALALGVGASAQLVDGAVAVADIGSGELLCIDAVSSQPPGCPGVVPSGGPFASLRGVSVDRLGFPYLSDRGTSAVYRIDPVAGTRANATNGVSFLTLNRGLVVTPVGDSYVVDPGLTGIPIVVRLDGGSGAQTAVAQGGNLRFPTGIALDPAGAAAPLLVVGDAGSATGLEPPLGPPRIDQGVTRVDPTAFDPAFPPGNQTALCVDLPFLATPRRVDVDPGDTASIADDTIVLADSGDGLPLGVPPQLVRILSGAFRGRCSDGTACARDADCTRACQGGPNPGDGCSGDEDCGAGGECDLCRHGVCDGNSPTPGLACDDDPQVDYCGSGSCLIGACDASSSEDDRGMPCRSDAECPNGSCRFGRGVCDAASLVDDRGQPCTSDDDCVTALGICRGVGACDAASTNPGAPCSDDSECPQGACVANACDENSIVDDRGDACRDDADCFPPPVCEGGPNAGQSCGTDNDCGVCVGGPNAGEGCSTDGDCGMGGTCMGGTCPRAGSCRAGFPRRPRSCSGRSGSRWTTTAASSWRTPAPGRSTASRRRPTRSCRSRAASAPRSARCWRAG